MTKKVVSPAAAAEIKPAPAPMSISTLEIPVELIDPNPEQPRVVFDEEELKGLAQSIKENGVIVPIVVEEGLNGRFIHRCGAGRHVELIPSVCDKNLATSSSAVIASLIRRLQ